MKFGGQGEDQRHRQRGSGAEKTLLSRPSQRNRGKGVRERRGGAPDQPWQTMTKMKGSAGTAGGFRAAPEPPSARASCPGGEGPDQLERAQMVKSTGGGESRRSLNSGFEVEDTVPRRPVRREDQ